MNSRKELNARYRQVMKSARKQMGVLGKFWSVFIHLPPVDLLLGLLDRTILRPIPLLTSGIVALAGGLGLYSITLYNGYQMYGAEIPLLLIGGLFIGIAFDYLQILFNGND